MQFHLPAIESPAAGASRILTGLLENAGDRLASPTATSDINIHEIRKICKKLRALLRMVRPALADDEFRTLDRGIRDFARQLGMRRDNKVILDTLDYIVERFAPLLRQETFSSVHEALLHMKTHADGTVAALDIEALQAHLAGILAMARTADYRRITDKTLLAGVVDGYRRGRRRLARMASSPDTGNAHALRRLAKYQYYQLQMLAVWNDTALQPLVSRFHRLEETLGNDHDLAVLEQTIAEYPEICPDRVCRELLNALIESRRITLMSRALRLAQALYRAKPGKYRARLEAACTPSA